jgi:hypothetical protein
VEHVGQLTDPETCRPVLSSNLHNLEDVWHIEDQRKNAESGVTNQ